MLKSIGSEPACSLRCWHNFDFEIKEHKARIISNIREVNRDLHGSTDFEGVISLEWFERVVKQ